MILLMSRTSGEDMIIGKPKDIRYIPLESVLLLYVSDIPRVRVLRLPLCMSTMAPSSDTG